MPRTPSPAAEIAAALASRPEEVCRRYLPQGKKQGRYWVAGDLEGSPGRSLFVRLKPPGVPGKWCDAATGEHGDLLDLIRRRSAASTLRAAMDEARAFLALPAPLLPGEGPPYDAREAARRIWRRCRAVDTAPAEAYLRARGITRCRFPSLRFHPALFHREADRRLPALVAAVTDTDGTIHGVHRTWIDPGATAKAGVSPPRKALGQVFGHAVRFGAPDATLLVGEGLETVLSLVSAAPRIPAAAALSAGSLGAFIPPEGVSRLIIARDNDVEGERAAERLARRCVRAGVTARVIVSERGDFNDDLAALGSAVLAVRLGPLFRFAGVGEVPPLDTSPFVHASSIESRTARRPLSSTGNTRKSPVP